MQGDISFLKERHGAPLFQYSVTNTLAPTTRTGLYDKEKDANHSYIKNGLAGLLQAAQSAAHQMQPGSPRTEPPDLQAVVARPWLAPITCQPDTTPSQRAAGEGRSYTAGSAQRSTFRAPLEDGKGAAVLHSFF